MNKNNPDYILNPVSGRYVKKTGKIGKNILKQQLLKNIEKPPTIQVDTSLPFLEKFPIDILYEIISKLENTDIHKLCNMSTALDTKIKIVLENYDNSPIVEKHINNELDFKLIENKKNRYKLIVNFPYKNYKLPTKTHELIFKSVKYQISYYKFILSNIHEYSKLKIINFKKTNFNQPLSSIKFPPNLEELILSDDFNLPIENVIFPDNLKTLYFGDSFNYPLDKVSFPKNIKSLYLGYSFNQSLGILPDSLEKLHINCPFINFESIVFPLKLKILIIMIKFYSIFTANAFPNLEELYIWDKTLPLDMIEILPKLRILKFHSYDKDIDKLKVYNLKKYPDLQEFKLPRLNNELYNNIKLPNNLRSLEFCYTFDYPLDNILLPNSLNEIRFGVSFDKPINNIVFPDQIELILFGGYFNQPIDSVTFPSNLKKLIFKYSFNQPLDRVAFPPNLRILRIRSFVFNRIIDNVKFPPHLEELHLGYAFNKSIDFVEFPPSLKILYLSRYFNKSINRLYLLPKLEEFYLGYVSDMKYHYNGKNTWTYYNSSFKQSIENLKFNPNLKKLFLRKTNKFSQRDLENLTLPPNLQELIIITNVNVSFENIKLPDKLQTLCLVNSLNQKSLYYLQNTYPGLNIHLK